MPRALVITQLRENYGAHSWDGEGACPQYWKNKGSYEYVVELPPANLLPQPPEQEEILDLLAAAAAYANVYAAEHVTSRRVLADGEKSPAEREFEDLLTQGLADESDRKAYLPEVLTLGEIETKARENRLVKATTEETSHVNA